MTVEIIYNFGSTRVKSLGDWNVDMAKQIESNRGFSINDIERELRGNSLIVRVDTSLPNQAVENMLSDIEDHLPNTAYHVETRDV